MSLLGHIDKVEGPDDRDDFQEYTSEDILKHLDEGFCPDRTNWEKRDPWCTACETIDLALEFLNGEREWIGDDDDEDEPQ